MELDRARPSVAGVPRETSPRFALRQAVARANSSPHANWNDWRGSRAGRLVRSRRAMLPPRVRPIGGRGRCCGRYRESAGAVRAFPHDSCCGHRPPVRPNDRGAARWTRVAPPHAAAAARRSRARVRHRARRQMADPAAPSPPARRRATAQSKKSPGVSLFCHAESGRIGFNHGNTVDVAALMISNNGICAASLTDHTSTPPPKW